MSFSLAPHHWYAWQMIPGYVGQRSIPYCSPIWVQTVTPKKTGRGILRVAFWNTEYAEGVQNFELDLQILHRSDDYLIAKLVGGDPSVDRCTIVSHIEFGWIEKFCPWLWHNHPPHRYGSPADSSVSMYLDAVFHPNYGVQEAQQ
jgi:hypothetical protein